MRVDGYRVLDFKFGVQTALPDVRSALRRPFGQYRRETASEDAPLYRIDRTDRGVLEVLIGDRCVHRSATLDDLVDFLFWHTHQTAVAGVSQAVVIHAAAAARSGAAVVLPAPTNHGKSTTVAGLVRGGYAYLTDEATLIDPVTLGVHPFPRPMRLDPPSVRVVLDGAAHLEIGSAAGAPALVLPEDLGSHASVDPVPVRLFVSPRYAEGSTTELTPMGRPEMLQLLASSCMNLQRWRGRGIEVLGDLVADAECYRLGFADLDEAVATIDDLMDRVTSAEGQFV